MKKPICASKQDVSELTILRYIINSNTTPERLWPYCADFFFNLTSSHLLVSTSDESCFNVLVRFLLASFNARWFSFGLYDSPATPSAAAAAGAAWAGAGSAAGAQAGWAGAAAAWAAALAAAAATAAAAAAAACVVEETLGCRETELPAIEVLDLFAALAVAEFTVDSWSCISIMWSPRRMVRFKGALPLKKSTT